MTKQYPTETTMSFKIEITSEMVSAGASALFECDGSRLHPLDFGIAEAYAMSVFEAMIRASRQAISTERAKGRTRKAA